jgi:DNA-3-methyladenine glycosylase II
MISLCLVDLRTSTGSLEPAAPFDFGVSLAFLEAFAPVQDDQEIGEDRFRKAVVVGDEPAVFELRDEGSVEAPALRFSVWSRAGGAAVERAAARQAGFMLSLDDELAPFYEIARGDPGFAAVIEELYGLHHVKLPSAFEAACWAVLASHCPMPVARKMKRALVERFGPSLAVDSADYRAFPTQPMLAQADRAELEAVIGNSRRAGYLGNVVEAFADIDDDFLRSAPWDEAEARLRSIKGVGEWSAAFTLLRGLGRMERMPLGMKPMLAALEQLYGDRTTMQEIAERYGPWLGYWAFYLRVATGRRGRAGPGRRAAR